MTELTQKQRDHLATVMGWLVNEDHWAIPNPGGADGSDVQWEFMPMIDWTPDQNIHQAMMLVADDSLDIDKTMKAEKVFMVVIRTAESPRPVGYGDTLEQAICQAKLKQTGYEV